MTERHLISSGGPWEGRGGYSRAVAIGDDCWVSGTTDAGPDGRSRHPGDIGSQTKAAFEIIAAALGEAGFETGDIVRTRMFVTDISRSAEVLAVHGDVFRDIRPSSTMVQVSALIDPSLLIEVEVDAHRNRERSG